MKVQKLLFSLLPWALLIIALLFLWRNCSRENIITVKPPERKLTVNHQLIVNKIEAIGKLELVKYYLKDIVDYSEDLEFLYGLFRAEDKAVLIVTGEIIGCVDLTKIDSSAIELHEDYIRIKLPEPEICSYKIDHENSKVYSRDQSFLSEKDPTELIDSAYIFAERQIRASAHELKVLEQTKRNAVLVLSPLLEQITGKPVDLYFEGEVSPFLQPEEDNEKDTTANEPLTQ